MKQFKVAEEIISFFRNNDAFASIISDDYSTVEVSVRNDEIEDLVFTIKEDTSNVMFTSIKSTNKLEKSMQILLTEEFSLNHGPFDKIYVGNDYFELEGSTEFSKDFLHTLRKTLWYLRESKLSALAKLLNRADCYHYEINIK